MNRHNFFTSRFHPLFIILPVLFVFITSCAPVSVEEHQTGDPGESAKEWFGAVNQLDILKADGLTCTTRRKALRIEIEDRMIRGIPLIVFKELFDDPEDIELDLSGIEFITVEQEGNQALVTAKGEIRAAIDTSIHTAQVDGNWLMVLENDEWRWCGISDVSLQEKRTYYDTLALETPEEAVRTFSNAFQRRDFMTVYLVLAPRTQFRMEQHLNLLQYSHFVQMDHWDEVKSEVSIFAHGIGYGEHQDGDMGYLFDQLMLAASRHDALLIDLRGDITILGTETAELSWEGAAIDVFTEVEDIEGKVVFRTVQAPSGRWRVFQVIVPGGDEELWPWAVKNTDE